jgi:hypothetical protein
MYCLWKTQGARVEPWRKDVIVGAVPVEGGVALALTADADWEGRLIFDVPRHRINMGMPLDWPRINQFPEWFTVVAEAEYTVSDSQAGEPVMHTGKQLADGIEFKLEAGQERRLVVRVAPR